MYCIQTKEKMIINPTVIELSYDKGAKYKYTISVFVDGLWSDIAKSKDLLTAACFKNKLESWVKEVAMGLDFVKPVFVVDRFNLDLDEEK